MLSNKYKANVLETGFDPEAPTNLKDVTKLFNRKKLWKWTENQRALAENAKRPETRAALKHEVILCFLLAFHDTERTSVVQAL